MQEGNSCRAIFSLKQNNHAIKEYLIYIFLFITFAFPKAGGVIHGAPITISTILYGIVLLCMVLEILNYGKSHLYITIYFFVYVAFVLMNALFSLGNISLKQLLMAMVVAGSPVAFLIGKKVSFEDCMKILSIAGIIVGLYSVAQWLFGLTQTTIPGITLAFGDAWDNKPIGYGFSQIHEATKMPSTMQNGNNVALFSVLGIGALLCWMPSEKWSKKKWLSVCLLFVALVLSGSRSATYPFVILSPIGAYGCYKFYLHAESPQKKAFLRTTAETLVILVVLFQVPQLTTVANAPVMPDVSSSTAVDPKTEDPKTEDPKTEDPHVLKPPNIKDQSRLIQAVGNMSGRLTAWKSMWNKITNEYTFGELVRLIVMGAGGEDRMMGCEGLPLFISQYGVIPALLFMGLFIPLLTLYKYPTFLWSGLAFAGALVVDSSYNYPPIMIWFFILLGVFIANKSRSESRDDYENNHYILRPLAKRRG